MNAGSLIDVELNNWKATENKYRQQHGDGVMHDRKFLQQKLKTLRGIYNRNRGVRDKESRADLKILKGQVSALEKQLYSPAQLRLLRFGRAVAAIVNIVAKPAAMLAGMAWNKALPVMQEKVQQWRSGQPKPPPPSDQDIARQIQSSSKTSNNVHAAPAKAVTVDPLRRQRLFRIDPARKGRGMRH